MFLRLPDFDIGFKISRTSVRPKDKSPKLYKPDLYQ
jgi:hypothetical protein